MTTDFCELCGFSASLYGLESDLTSTAEVIGPIVVREAAADLPDEVVAANHGGTSIAELMASVENFEGDLLDTAHQALHTMAQIGQIRAAVGHGPIAGVGQVSGLHASGGGVPKAPLATVSIDRTGVVGDVQNNRIHHGRPIQALCLWSSDVMAALNAEGHPIEPGMAGENITITGIEWSPLRPGSRIHVGDIPVLVSAYAVPCSKIAAGFHERDFNRVNDELHPGWSRLYGMPLAEGTLSVGDVVSVG